jgi:TIR domain
MKVVLDVDIPPGEDFGRWTMEQIRRCDAVVIFCGEEVTNSQSREIEVAQRAEVRVIPIVFPGRSYKIPENLKKLQAIQIKDQDTEVAASRIARRIQERIAD